MLGSTISRDAVRSTRARSAVLLTAAVWLVTRVPFYLMDIGTIKVGWQEPYIGDIQIYQGWLPWFRTGTFPGGDVRWQYPAGAAGVLSLPHLLPFTYLDSFVILALLTDALITVLLARLAIRRGSWFGCWCWLLGIPMIGPIVFGRFDLFATLFAVLAIYFADTRWGLGVFSGLGAMVKVWPVVLLFGARRGRTRETVGYAVAAAGVLAVAYLAGTSGSLSFLHNQNSRGIEVEAAGAVPFLLFRLLGVWHGTIAYQYGSYEIIGSGVDTVAKLLLVTTVLAFGWLFFWRWRMTVWRPEVTGDAALVATLLMVVTSRVISPQYMVWLVGMAACCTVFPRTSQRPATVLVLLAAGVTQLIYPMLFAGMLHGDAIGALTLAFRDLLLIAAACVGCVRLWRSTRGRTAVGEADTAASPQESHAAKSLPSRSTP